MTATCTGRGALDGDHCCYVAGAECPFLERGTLPGRNYVCGLRRRLGSWPAVHADLEYQRLVQAEWDKVGIESCGAWQPPDGQCCAQKADDGVVAARTAAAAAVPGLGGPEDRAAAVGGGR